MAYIPGRYFRDGFSMEERNEVMDRYTESEWEYHIGLLDERGRRISKSAVRVAAVIEEKLGIRLFPLILKCAGRGFDMSGGSAAFFMLDIETRDYGFGSRVDKFKSMSGRYSTINLHGLRWVEREG